MKYLMYAEMKKGLTYEDGIKEMLAVQSKRQEKGEVVNTILGPFTFLTEQTKGISIMEVEDEAELIKYHAAYGHLFKIKFIPLIETAKLAEIRKS